MTKPTKKTTKRRRQYGDDTITGGFDRQSMNKAADAALARRGIIPRRRSWGYGSGQNPERMP